MKEMDIILNLRELEFDTESELTEAVIRKRWKELSRLYHPDVNDNEIFQNSKKQSRINVAKDFLIENLAEVNDYIRKQNYHPSDEEIRREQERAAREQAERERQERARKAAEEEARRAKEEAARKAQSSSSSSYSSSSYSSSSSSSSSSYGSSSYSSGSSRSSSYSTSTSSERSTPPYSSSYGSGSFSYSGNSSSSSYSRGPMSKKSKIVLGIIIGFVALVVILSVVLTIMEYVDKGKIGSKGARISSAEELIAIGENPDKAYRLANDIDLEGYEWKPILNFGGTFDGCGYTIKNVKITQFNSDYIGFFSTLATSGEIKNLTIENLEIDTARYGKAVGGIVGYSFGSVTDCSVTGVIKVTCDNVGGIVGYLENGDPGISGCTFDGTIIGGAGVGGIVGYGSPATITDCTSKGTITGSSYTGGIFGGFSTINATAYKVKNCTNEAVVNGNGEYTGGIVGRLYSGNAWGTPTLELTGCVNRGKVYGKNYTGGIAGFASTTTYNVEPEINELTNEANVKGCDYTGGILGFSGNQIILSNVSSSGTIEGEVYVGSIVGSASGAEISGVTNESEVKGKRFVGGIAGLAKKITDSENKAKVIASGFSTNEIAVGGIAGAVNVLNNVKNSAPIEVDYGFKGVGGLAGSIASSYDNVEIVNSDNSGAITCNRAKHVGGIIGKIELTSGNHTVTVSGCTNSGAITILGECIEPDTNVGGIIGYFNASSTIGSTEFTINSVKFEGIIAAHKTCQNVGGIIGKSSGGSMTIANATVNSSSIKGGNPMGSLVGKCNNVKNIDYSSCSTKTSPSLPSIG